MLSHGVAVIYRDLWILGFLCVLYLWHVNLALCKQGREEWMNGEGREVQESQRLAKKNQMESLIIAQTCVN